MAHQPGIGHRSRIFRKYVLVLVVLVSGSLLTSGLFELYFSYQEQKTQVVQLQQEKAALAAEKIAQFLDETTRQIEGTIPPGPGGTPETNDERRTELLRLLRLAPAITDLRYIDSTGHERERISRVVPNIVNSEADYSAESAFEKAAPGRPYFGPVTFKSGSEPYMQIGVRDRGVQSGVTLADVNLKLIWDVVSRIDVGPGGYAYVIDGRGKLVAHPDISLVLQETDLSALPQVAAVRRKDSATIDDSSGLSIDSSGKRIPVLTAHQRVDVPGWWVFVEQSQAEAFAPLYASVSRTLVLLAAGLVLSVAASLLLARRMVTPIQALRKGAALIGEGALDHRISVRSGDELEELAHDFNTMADQLRASYSELEERVAERTADLVEAVHQAAAAGRDLEIVNQHKSEYLASMSHELRTPLNAIIGFSELLENRMIGELTERQAGYLRDIQGAGRHMLSLVNDILDLSKIEAGRMELELSDFSLGDLLANAVSIIREWAIRNGLKLHLELPPNDVIVRGDERKVRQTMFNLLSNAVRFTPKGGTIHVSAFASPVERQVRVSVRDTGIGISAEEQSHIFDEFYQVKGQGGQAHAGTGLGLALSRKFVELHGGWLSVASELGVGSTFSVTLPISALEAVPRSPTAPNSMSAVIGAQSM